MIKKLPRQECIALNPQLPLSDDAKGRYVFPKYLEAHVLIFGQAKDSVELGSVTTDFFHILGIDVLTFLGDSDIPWLSQNNDEVSVKEAFQYFKEQKIGKQFNGGFRVDTGDLPVFLRHLFSLTRFNAAFPIVHFTDDNKGIVASLCRRGHLHVFTLTEVVEHMFASVVAKSAFEFGQDIRD